MRDEAKTPVIVGVQHTSGFLKGIFATQENSSKSNAELKLTIWLGDSEI